MRPLEWHTYICAGTHAHVHSKRWQCRPCSVTPSLPVKARLRRTLGFCWALSYYWLWIDVPPTSIPPSTAHKLNYTLSSHSTDAWCPCGRINCMIHLGAGFPPPSSKRQDANRWVLTSDVNLAVFDKASEALPDCTDANHARHQTRTHSCVSTYTSRWIAYGSA